MGTTLINIGSHLLISFLYFFRYICWHVLSIYWLMAKRRSSCSFVAISSRLTVIMIWIIAIFLIDHFIFFLRNLFMFSIHLFQAFGSSFSMCLCIQNVASQLHKLTEHAQTNMGGSPNPTKFSHAQNSHWPQLLSHDHPTLF